MLSTLSAETAAHAMRFLVSLDRFTGGALNENNAHRIRAVQLGAPAGLVSVVGQYRSFENVVIGSLIVLGNIAREGTRTRNQSTRIETPFSALLLDICRGAGEGRGHSPFPACDNCPALLRAGVCGVVLQAAQAPGTRGDVRQKALAVLRNVALNRTCALEMVQADLHCQIIDVMLWSSEDPGVMLQGVECIRNLPSNCKDDGLHAKLLQCGVHDLVCSLGQRKAVSPGDELLKHACAECVKALEAGTRCEPTAAEGPSWTGAATALGAAAAIAAAVGWTFGRAAQRSAGDGDNDVVSPRAAAAAALGLIPNLTPPLPAVHDLRSPTAMAQSPRMGVPSAAVVRPGDPGRAAAASRLVRR